MIIPQQYRKAFYFAMGLHFGLMILLCMESSQSRAVLTAESQNTPGLTQTSTASAQTEIVKAVAVDNKKLMQTVERLKQEREQKQKAEINKQNELNRQVALAKQERVKEQQRLAQLKEEANKIAILRKKQAIEEQKHLKELAEQKALETKHLKEIQDQKDKLVKQQQLEEDKLAQLNKEKTQKVQAEKLKSDLAKAAQEKIDKALAQREAQEKQIQNQAAAAQQAREQAEDQARLAGVVDKYKALILNAIGKNWILPEHVDGSLSSQFRIRLAPDGTVLEVSLTRTSGDTLLDRSAQTAIYKASPLPVPADVTTFNIFRDISLTVRPEQIRG
ncbi:MAG: cell envelope integrity protein TolA [Legionella sp.]|nr:cell envelope integrity protein TolA [Legionella sp.]